MHFFRAKAYTGLYIILRGKDLSMDECIVTPIPINPIPTENAGDVDDLIFLNSPDWFASER